MSITRERQSDYSKRKTDWRGDPCSCERADTGIWHFYRKYAGRGRIIVGTEICRPRANGVRPYIWDQRGVGAPPLQVGICD